jgi:hypothetical protein
VNRDNISRRLISRILSEYRDIDSKISFVFSDFQVIGNIRDDRNEGDDNNNYKKNSPSMRRSISIISFVSCEEERANIDKINQN